MKLIVVFVPICFNFRAQGWPIDSVVDMPDRFDVDGDGSLSPGDVIALVDAIREDDAFSAHLDLDFSGTVDEQDVSLLIDVVRRHKSQVVETRRRQPRSTSNALGTESAELNVILTPSDPGPYLPGEQVSVDVFVQRIASGPSNSIRLIQFDTAETNPSLGLTLPLTHLNSIAPYAPFQFWEFSSTAACVANPAACGIGYFDIGLPLISATWYELSPDSARQLTIPGDTTPLFLGTLLVACPDQPGTYRLDLLNADELDINYGTLVSSGFGGPTDPLLYFRASSGQIVGGQLDVVVGPDKGPRGACCSFSGVCMNDIPEEECDGTWRGSETSCRDTTCPTNEVCSRAIQIEDGETVHGNTYNAIDNTLWWLYVAPQTGFATAQLIGRPLDGGVTTVRTSVSAYSLCEGTAFESAAGTCGCHPAEATFDVVEGEWYWISSSSRAGDSYVPWFDIDLTVATIPYESPTIIREPLDQTTCVGHKACISVNATGVPTPACQWFHDGQPVAASNGTTTLCIENVTLDDAGSYSCAVQNPGGSVPTRSANLTIVDPCPHTTILPAGEVSVSCTPVAIASANLDGNRKLDLAVICSDSSTGTVFLDPVSPRMGVVSLSNVGESPHAIAAGAFVPFDRSTIEDPVDLVVASDSGATYLENRLAETANRNVAHAVVDRFANVGSCGASVSGARPAIGVVLANVNSNAPADNRGKLDVVVLMDEATNTSGFSRTVLSCLGDGSGTAQDGCRCACCDDQTFSDVESSSRFLAVGDGPFSDTSLIVAGGFSVTIYENERYESNYGWLGWRQNESLTLNSEPRDLVVADLSGNGWDEVITTHEDYVSVFKDSGGSIEQEPLEISFGPFKSPPSGHVVLTAADCDGDNDLDLVVAHGPLQSLFIFTNLGQNQKVVSFAPPIEWALPAGCDPVAIEAADFNGDGLPDIAVADAYSKSIHFWNNRSTCLTRPDIDGDGDVDRIDWFVCAGCLEPDAGGPGVPAALNCHGVDFDCDGDFDLLDAASFQNDFVEP